MYDRQPYCRTVSFDSPDHNDPQRGLASTAQNTLKPPAHNPVATEVLQGQRDKLRHVIGGHLLCAPTLRNI
ncbi:hypothetical protein GOODEAATRI_021664 [Goodea atripinnis]|uniref:Uncharacterized protein n=1 Tax=Goodea atripinnis TaxID=208336 RepID=A0ABV0P6S9_9TELE